MRHLEKLHATTDRQTGFALVVALSLMAFVLMLSLSSTFFVHVENINSQSTKARLQARESARLALMMAIGDLQRHAGPDQRVTARADIMHSAPAIKNPFWTAVWDTTKPSAPPRWLVSWQDQSTPAPSRTMQLVDAGSVGNDATQYISAPIISAIGPQNTVSDEIAWWISDEGIKTSLGQRPLSLQDGPNYIASLSRLSLNTMLATSQGIEELFTDYNRFTSAGAARLEQLTSTQQLLAMDSFKNTASWQFPEEQAFHATTPLSLGVLASVLPNANGGLMRDLSLFPRLISSGFENYINQAVESAQLKANATDPIEALQRSTQLQGLAALGPLQNGEIAMPTLPILSNFMIAFTVRSESPVASHPNFYLRMRFFSEFWNPFTTALAMKDSSGNALDLELEILGLPTVMVQKTTGTGNSSAPIDLQNLLKAPSNTAGAVIIKLRYDPTEPWLPGRSKNWTGVDAATATGASPYESTTTNSKAWTDADNTLGGSTGIDTGIPRLSGNIRHYSTDPHTLKINVYATTPTTGERELLSTLDGLTYQAVSTRPSGYSNTHSGATFGYHFILRGPQFSAVDLEFYRGLWLHDHDPRNPTPLIRNDWNLDNDPIAHTGSPYAPVKDGISPLLTPTPAEINETNNTINTVVFRRILDRSNGHTAAGGYFNQLWQDAPLFELPRERPLALASLQHLYFHNERPFKVGNSWGDQGATNTLAWFDQYYFSGFARTDDPNDYKPDRPLPNPSLITYAFDSPKAALTDWQHASPASTAAATELAQKAMVLNRFNLNSTSVPAWKAVLAGLRFHAWEYLNYPQDTSDLSSLVVSQDSRDRLFARFSQSLAETYDAPATPAFAGTEPVAPSAYYRRGARHFDAESIETLAKEIVTRIQARSRPFHSIESFLAEEPGANGSLLEQAIAAVFAPDGRQKWDHLWETTGIRGPSAAIIDIDHFSPGFLTQADIMTAIGPMLSPRSDTFKIRARSTSHSPLGETIASAALEATLQRTPEPLIPTTTPNIATNRKFKIISIRWLTDQEI